MSFIYGKWRAVERLKELRDRYGENSALLAQDGLSKVKKEKRAKTIHSFPELLNKRVKVPVNPIDPRFAPQPVVSYVITTKEKEMATERRKQRSELALRLDN